MAGFVYGGLGPRFGFTAEDDLQLEQLCRTLAKVAPSGSSKKLGLKMRHTENAKCTQDYYDLICCGDSVLRFTLGVHDELTYIDTQTSDDWMPRVGKLLKSGRHLIEYDGIPQHANYED